MSTPPRRPSLSFCVAVVALLVATGSTSYAAGLARNSVGTVQLKPNAVTAAKVKDGSLSGADLKDGSLSGADLKDGSLSGADLANGSVGLADLAPAAAPPHDSTLVTYLGETNGNLELMRTADFVLSVDCSVDDNEARLSVTPPDPAGALLTTGLEARQDKNGLTVNPAIQSALQIIAQAPQNAAGTSTFEGAIRYGTRPWVRLSISIRAEDFSSTQGCPVRFVATPGR